MLIRLTELLTAEGKEKTYEMLLDMKRFQGPEGEYPVTEKKPIFIRIRHLGDRKLFLEGRAEFHLEIPCGRCLEPVSCPFELELVREVDLAQSEDQRLEMLDEQPYVSGYDLDVDQLVQNELILNLPMKVLCKEDCKGICSRCGTNLNHESCDCDTFSPDPRMSVIQDIFKQFKEV